MDLCIPLNHHGLQTPHIAKSVDVQHIQVRRSNQHILQEARDHMPRVEIEERRKQIQAVRTNQSDENSQERIIAK